MAPMAVDDAHSLKRNSTTANLGFPPTKKHHFRSVRHHKLTWVADEAIRHQSPPQDEESVQALLARSITLALEAVGFQGADSTVVEAFRAETEQYMLHFLATVRQSMLACRRTQPLPLDFLQSLHLHQLSLRSLLPHLDPPVPPSKSQISLSLDDVAQKPHQQQLPTLDSALGDRNKTEHTSYIPKSFPSLPSEHTYKATPDVPVRENDPRKIRERAIEEGRLGESALRKLVGLRADDVLVPGVQTRQKVNSMRVMRYEAWEKAMEASAPTQATTTSIQSSARTVTEDDPKKPENALLKKYSAPIVNADRRHWRKPGKSRTAMMGQEPDPH